jgi:succinyl-CoA synthetase beta subunit
VAGSQEGIVNIHEYQAKEILASRRVPVPAGRVAVSPEQAGRAFEDLRVERAVVKAQIHAGGRGRAGGVVHVASRTAAEETARRLLGSYLVTPQTGPRGRRVDKVLVQERLDFQTELYLSVTLDRARGVPMVMASARGGVDIETLARDEPESIIRECGNPHTGLAPFQARKVFSRLDLPRTVMGPTCEIILRLAKTFVDLDCSLIELNPLALLKDGGLSAIDVKMTFEDNGLLRHRELLDLRDPAQEDPREVQAERHDLSYVGLEGTVGCMVNGAGLAMATMDLIRLKGGEPANFLDVGGNATVEKVVAAFELICQDEHVHAILVNIFGGIVRCDLIAEGIVQAARQTALTVPLVVRLEGTRAAEGRAALAAAGLDLVPADSLEEAAAKIVELAKR